MKKKILIVDDNSNDRYLLEAVLKGYGYDVTSTENGAEALLLARKCPPDAIISDIMMPLMDGFGLCREWKLDETLKTIPFIFYTATYTTYKDKEFGMSLGAERFLIKPQEPKALVAKLRQVLEEHDVKKSVVFEFPLGKEMEFFRDYNKLLFQKLETKMAELQNEKKFLKSIFESLTHPFYVIDTGSYVVLMANPAARMNQLTEGSKCFTLTHKRNIPCSGDDICPLEEVKKTKKPVTLEHVHYDNDGNARNVEVHGYPIFDNEGKVVQMIEYSLDITERKQIEEQNKASLEEKEVLLREIHHRVKNNMQIISSLLGLQSGYFKETKYREMFKDSQNRINSMSLIHEKLYRSKDLAKIDLKEYIRDLANSLFYSNSAVGIIELSLNIENGSLGIDQALPCGLIINELITNSLKYAFPDGRKGEIKISLCLNDENMVELVVSDNGVGIPDDVDFRKTESLGLRLVTILTENQLQGEISLDRNRGTEFKIKFKGA